MHILVLLCCVFIISTNGKKSASSRCRVRRFEKKLDCRGVGFSRIPKIDKGILIAYVKYFGYKLICFVKNQLKSIRSVPAL